MGDTCFVEYSTLGGGKTRPDYDNQLTEAPEEEGDFDVLNDETFGDFGNVTEEQFDWEEQHEKFAEVLESNGNRTADSGFHTAEKAYRSHEEYMEQSISQLVVEDEDVDPAHAHRARPIPRKQQSLDMLFGPSSPPSLLDAEYLVSPTSKNIWCSPRVESPPPLQQVDTIQSLFDFAKCAAKDSPAKHGGGPGVMVLPKAQTLEEIESALLPRPRVLTAEALERQLRGEMVPDGTPIPHRGLNGRPAPRANFSIPPPALPMGMQNTPPPRQMPLRGPPGISPAMVMNGRVSPLQQMGTPVPQATFRTPINRQSPVLQMALSPSPVPRPLTPPPMFPMSGRRSPLQLVPARFVSPYAQGNQQRYIATPGRGLSQPIRIPPTAVAMHGSPFSSPQGPYESPGFRHQSPQQRMPPPGAFSDPGFNRTMQHRFQSPQQRAPPYNNRERNYRSDYSNSREHRYHRPPYNQRLPEAGDRALGPPPGRGVDDFVGLMTQKEKDWIIKIQMLQLQTENPYLDDYYYTAYCMKKKARERMEKGDKEASNPELVIPAMAHMENRAYKPAQFEGSLGRLTTSSVHNPRQIIDLLAKSVSESEGTAKTKTHVGKELRKSRQLLLDIEKGYNLLLEVDDIEKKILALPEDARQALFEERQYRIDLLFHYLLCDGNSKEFMQYMNVRKGRTLTARALPLLDKVQAVGIVSLVCKNIQLLMKKDQPGEDLDRLFTPCARVMGECNLATLVMFVEDVQQEESQSQAKPIAIAIQNKFGISILTCLLHRGEEIYSTTSAVDMDSRLQDEWCQFVQDFAVILAVVPRESIVPPLTPYPGVSEHLGRVLDKRLVGAVEDQLGLLTQPRTDPTPS